MIHHIITLTIFPLTNIGFYIGNDISSVGVVQAIVKLGIPVMSQVSDEFTSLKYNMLFNVNPFFWTVLPIVAKAVPIRWEETPA